jgi:hypothetical protein
VGVSARRDIAPRPPDPRQFIKFCKCAPRDRVPDVVPQVLEIGDVDVGLEIQKLTLPSFGDAIVSERAAIRMVPKSEVFNGSARAVGGRTIQTICFLVDLSKRTLETLKES